MNELDHLQNLFAKLPGIGPRQARRFAYFFMYVSQDYVDSFIDTLSVLRSNKFHCEQCNRVYFKTNTHNENSLCQTCADETRDSSKILLVAKQADFENIERSNSWNGHYFILGRTIRLADKNPENSLPIPLLRQRLADFSLAELVIGLPLNPEGLHTGDIILDMITDLTKDNSIKVSHLGRGLSIGSELEYSDPQTIAAALENRS